MIDGEADTFYIYRIFWAGVFIENQLPNIEATLLYLQVNAAYMKSLSFLIDAN